jgi:hydrogenase large subunit
MTKITIDPVTRIEGHLKIGVELDGSNTVISANVTGNLYRGFENILTNRHPFDAVYITQRICGVCPVSHSIASAKANEQAIGFTPNDQALLLRALIQGGNYLQDHLLHFYHLNLMDYVAGPSLPPFTPATSADQRFTSSQASQLVNNYLTALRMRCQAQEMVAIVAGKVPHVSSVLPGGVTHSITAAQIGDFRAYLTILQRFINDTYLPDAQLLARVYSDHYGFGKGPGNLICYGGFDQPGGSTLFKRGRIYDGSSASVDIAQIGEHVGHSYYSSPSGLNPVSGQTTPSYGKSGAYSWLKASRYAGGVHEAGPLARMKVSGYYTGGVSVMDRIMARALETQKIANAMTTWLSQVVAGGDAYTRVACSSGSGVGLTEAPRGALGHWLQYSDAKITRYQVVTPTCWNASPKDDAGVAGAMEQALVGAHVANPDQPVELLRIVHSFDPCTGCSVHVISPEKGISSEFVVAHPTSARWG